jgi:hypothetical protein
MKYRKRALKISSLSDQLHLRSRLAILAAIGSVEAVRREQPDFQASQALEAKALQYLSEEKMARNPSGTFSIQFDTRTSMGSYEHAQY